MSKQDEFTPVSYPVYPTTRKGERMGWWQVGFAIGCGIWILSVVPLALAVAWLVIMGIGF